jgi:hypothetical protein
VVAQSAVAHQPSVLELTKTGGDQAGPGGAFNLSLSGAILPTDNNSGQYRRTRYWSGGWPLSQADPTRCYTGVTADLRARLDDHNAGRCPHTAKTRPLAVDVIVKFADERRALASNAI